MPATCAALNALRIGGFPVAADSTGTIGGAPCSMFTHQLASPEAGERGSRGAGAAAGVLRGGDTDGSSSCCISLFPSALPLPRCTPLVGCAQSGA